MAKVAVRGAGSDDQVVVADRVRTAAGIGGVKEQAARCSVDARHFGLQYRQIAALHLAAQHMANRRADRWRTQTGRRNLVEQGLEEMVICAVDDCDVYFRPGQGFDGFHVAKTAAYYCDPWHVGVHVRTAFTEESAAHSVSKSFVNAKAKRRQYKRTAIKADKVHG